MKSYETMDKLDYAILNVLQENNCIRKVQAITRKDIMEVIEIQRVTLHRRLKKLLNLNLVDQGLREGREHTYYISQMGIKLLEEELG